MCVCETVISAANRVSGVVLRSTAEPSAERRAAESCTHIPNYRNTGHRYHCLVINIKINVLIHSNYYK